MKWSTAVICLLVGTAAAVAWAYEADNHVGDLEDSGPHGVASGDVDMNSNNILDLGYVESDDADVADSGVVRLGNAECIAWENNPTGTDTTLCSTAAVVAVTAGDVAVDATKKLVLDGDGDTDTYIYEYSEDAVAFVTGGTTNMQFSTSAFTLNAGSNGDAILNSTVANGEQAMDLYLNRQDTTTAAGTIISNIYMRGDDDAAATEDYANLQATVVDDAAAGPDGKLCIQVAEDGSLTDYLCATGATGGGTVVLSKDLEVPNFTYYKDIPIGAAALGPTAPTWAQQDTLIALQFDAIGETIGITVEIADCWTADSDLTIELYITTETGDVIADTEVIEFDCTYRSLADGEVSDNGTAVTIQPSYTQSGAGTDSSRHKLAGIIDYDSANQPIAAGDNLHMHCNRDVGASDTYSGFVLMEKIELEYTCNGIPNH